MYVQVGDLAVVGDCSTVPLTQISCNTVFSKSQNARKVGTLCIFVGCAFDGYSDSIVVFICSIVLVLSS